MVDFSKIWSADSEEPSDGDYIVYIRTTSTAIKVYPGEIVDVGDNGKITFETNAGLQSHAGGFETYDLYTNSANLPYQKKGGGILAPYSMYEDHGKINKDDTELTLPSLRFGKEALVPTQNGFAICDHENLQEVQAARAKSLTAYNIGGGIGEDRVTVCTDCETIRF